MQPTAGTFADMHPSVPVSQSLRAQNFVAASWCSSTKRRLSEAYVPLLCQPTIAALADSDITAQIPMPERTFAYPPAQSKFDAFPGASIDAMAPRA